MSDIAIEMDEELRVQTCAQCGREYPRVHGFIYLNGDACAVYWADLYADHPHHPEPKALFVIALGDDWSEGSDRSNHYWVTLEVWPELDEVKMAFIDSVDGLDPAHFGRPLSREVALAHSGKETFLALADEIAHKDKRVSVSLGTSGP